MTATIASGLKVDGGIFTDLARVPELAGALEQQGYDACWTGEINHDPFLPLLLAAEHTTFQDSAHFPNGTVPGDGVHIVWPLVLGTNRGRYFLLTGQKISAQEALTLGVVNEVLPRDRVLPRAWELAEQIAKRPTLAIRYARVAMTQTLKRMMLDHLGYGLALEGLGAGEHWPAPAR